MKRLLFAVTVLLLSAAQADLAAAQPSASGPQKRSAATQSAPTNAQTTSPGAMGNAMPGMMGQGAMGMCPGMMTGATGSGTMMGCWMMMAMGGCPGMLGPDTRLALTKLPKGVSMSITSDDPQVIARVQSAADGTGHCMMGQGAQGNMMGHGMMGTGHGMMGNGAAGSARTGAGATSGMGMCPGMMAPGTNVQVTRVAKGVSINVTADESKAIGRVQKVAEAMRLMHEASQE